MTDPDPHDWLRDPNDGAYEKAERIGPPLDYVVEKLRASLESSHEALAALRDTPEDISAEGAHGPAFHVWMSFEYALKSYLALNNMLALTNEIHVCKRLAGFSRGQFREWLDRIQRQGSVTGQ